MSPLNLDSFRAMVSTHNYGDVRLAQDGGLEKVNNGFFRRNVKLAKVAISADENHYVRHAFLSSLAGKVDSDTFLKLREKLGIAELCRSETIADTYDKPLSRREIKAVLDIVDKNIMAHCISGSAGARGILADNGAKGLASIIKTYNNRQGLAPAMKIAAKEWQLKTIMTVHSLELQAVAAEAESANGDALAAVADRVRIYLNDPKLSGVKAQKGAKVVTDVTIFKDNGRWLNLCNFGLRQDSLAKAMRGEKLGAKDFAPTSLVTLSRIDVAKFFEEKARCEHYSFADAKCDKFYETICSDFVDSYSRNLTRNPIRMSVGRIAPSKHCFDLVKDGDVAANQAKIKDFLDAVRKLPRMTADQFVASTKVMNQTVYNLPKTFGYVVPDKDNIHATITASFGTVEVSLKWTNLPNNENKPLSGEFRYSVDQKGMVQVTKLEMGVQA